MSLLSCQKTSVERGGRAVVSDISLDIQAGQLIGLIGPNGAGKSTLLRALAGVCKTSAGEVELLGQAIETYSPAQRAQKLAWLAQSGPINWPLSVERLIALGRTPHQSAWQKSTSTDQNVIERVLTETDCQSLRHRDATSLSGGERARVLLARALVSEPSLLLADEPVAALDLAHQLQTMELLRRYAQGEQSCLVVMHDLSLAARYCDQLILMDEGKMVASGTCNEVLTVETLRTVYGVEAEIGTGDIPWVLPKHLL